MVNAFHQIKNAKNAAKTVSNHSETHLEMFREEMGAAKIKFRFSDSASFQDVRGVCEALVQTGWEEIEEESAYRGTLTFTWDKKVLTE